LFQPIVNNSIKKSLITALAFDSLQQQIFVGSRSSKIYTLNQTLTIVDSVRLQSPPSDIKNVAGQQLISELGIMDPNEQALGSLISLDRTSNIQKLIIDSLQRPVFFEANDLNDDGFDDFIVCAYGNYTGELLLFEGTADKHFERRPLSATPGARKIVLHDFNGDGLTDIMALMAQGDERIIIFYNKGNLDFEERVVLRFPPVYGSNYFELADFNYDGHPDILYTNGDNADFSITLKPYHAVRIFQNDGKNNFTEAWSTLMHGASQAVARDFDGDGDLDVAAIAYFADFERHPDHGFIYFQNEGNYKFMSITIPETKTGRWLVMESADIDRDGDEDIMLGSFSLFGMASNKSITENWKKNGNTLLLLKNLRFK
jgi:hypothetical protein